MDPEARRAHQREYQQKWRAANPDKVRAIKQRCNRKNRVKYNIVKRAWRRRNTDRIRAYSRQRRVKALYGLSRSDYESMRIVQNGRCAICGRSEGGFRKELSVDHCHRDGRVRALLCGPCNTGLGLFQDNSVRLRLAANYLERWAE